jgi:glycerol-3-phosphate dehydrogenase
VKKSEKSLHDCDLLVVGGGINGAGIARDAAGRGMSVVLCEKDDLASHTSSASTKLVHGGLRYLEQYEFRLVRKALLEREILMRSAPHIIKPLRFVFPHDQGQRPAWIIRAGMFLYDHLARREILPGSHAVSLRDHPAGTPLHGRLKKGFVYSDGWVDDARLVALNAIDAAQMGASILTRTRCLSLQRQDDRWRAKLEAADGRTIEVNAGAVVNATGPWAADFAHGASPDGPKRSLRRSKGSHIVVKKLFDHEYAYIFQHPDGRIVFAIPYENDYTLLGTTDLDYTGDNDAVRISPDEINYICELANLYFVKQVSTQDVVWAYSGVRPLLEDASASAQEVTRDYRLELSDTTPPMLSILGGKITTFRKLAEEAVDMLAPLLGNMKPGWTAGACLPGGDLHGTTPNARSVIEFDKFVDGLRKQYPWLAEGLAWRYARSYGTRTHLLLEGCTCMSDLGAEIVKGLYAAEASYLVKHEFAHDHQDILWRRTKLGLHITADEAGRLQAWLDQPIIEA